MKIILPFLSKNNFQTLELEYNLIEFLNTEDDLLKNKKNKLLFTA